MKAELRVMLVNGSYPPETCGVGDYTGKLAGALSGAGNIQVSVLTSSYLGIKAVFKPVRVLPSVDSWEALKSGKAAGIINNQRPDIAHFQLPNTEYKKNLAFNIMPALIHRKKTRVVQTWHEPIVKLGILGRLRAMFTMFFADGLIFVEEKNYDTMPWYVKAASEGKKKAFIKIGSNIPAVKVSASEKKALRKKSGAGKNQKLLVTFGFITETKGFDALLEAFDRDKFKWVHLGAINENEVFQKKWKQKAAQMGLYRLIKFMPGLPEKSVAKWLGAADVCVFPFSKGVSFRHGSFLAAAAQECYIVTTSFEKSGYDKKENIWYAKPGDREELARAMSFKAKAGRTKMVPKWESIAAQHYDFYRSL